MSLFVTKHLERILIRLDVFVIAGIPNNRVKNAQSLLHIFFGWITQYRQLKENRKKKRLINIPKFIIFAKNRYILNQQI